MSALRVLNDVVNQLEALSVSHSNAAKASSPKLSGQLNNDAQILLDAVAQLRSSIRVASIRVVIENLK